jgi:hypothetical protein
MFSATISKREEWTLSHMYALAIVQDASTKQAIQSARSGNLETKTGMPEPVADDFSVYPNPAQYGVTVSVLQMVNTAVAIYDVTGKEVLAAQIHETTTLPLHELKNGIYFIALTNSRGKETQKLIILK